MKNKFVSLRVLQFPELETDVYISKSLSSPGGKNNLSRTVDYFLHKCLSLEIRKLILSKSKLEKAYAAVISTRITGPMTGKEEDGENFKKNLNRNRHGT